MSVLAPALMSDLLEPGSATIEQAIRRVASPGYESWWQRCAAVGFCANPIHATATDPHTGRVVPMMIRCGNRRAAICPSCSDLYAADTWQLVHAGACGGHHDIPTTVVDRPQVFATLTAPSFGPVHSSGSRPGLPGSACHPADGDKTHCPRGNPLWCDAIHRQDDTSVGQPLCPDCYDYAGHVLFNWHAPELWRRFAIALRRAVTRHLRNTGADVELVRVSFVKVAEIPTPRHHPLPHPHPPRPRRPRRQQPNRGTRADGVGDRAGGAAAGSRPPGTGAHRDPRYLDDPCLRSSHAAVGDQIDTQALTPAHGAASEPTPGLARRVAAYLAKYTTKSVAEFGIAARRISAQVIDELDIPAHTRRILSTLASLAALPGNKAMLAWLHTLGYRGHITTKSRRYSITLTALRAARHRWRQRHADHAKHTGCQPDTQDGQEPPNAATELIDWRTRGAGHRNDGERLLVHTAAHQARQHRYLARLHDQHETGASP